MAAQERQLPAFSAEVKQYLDPLPLQNGRIAIVTGANGALGLALTRLLVAKGSRVIMACRNLESGEEARRLVQAEQPEEELSLEPLDLGSLASVREFAERLKAQLACIDLLFANAGIMAVARKVTEDGFESQFGVNHLGHFALVGLLLPLLSSAAESCLVSTTSSASFTGRIEFDDLMGEKQYNRWRAYGQSKLANVLFCEALQRRFESAGEDASAHAAHPGLVHTNLQRRAAGDAGSGVERWLLNRLVPMLGQSPEMGALPLIYAATWADAHGGDLWGPRWRYLRGRPVVQQPPAAALDLERQERLWQASERLTGVRYEFS